MSFRKLPTTDNELRDLLRDILDRLEALERGGAIAGNISLHTEIQLGDVTVTVTEGSGGHRTLQFTSPAGASHTIVL